MDKSLSPNPFTQRGAIHEPDRFFGRRTELNQINTRLRTMQSVSVVGERQIGKSSLLYHVYQTSASNIGASTQIVFTDLPNVADETGFYSRICGDLGGEGNSFGDLEKIVRGKRVVVCLDEFEKIAGQPAFSRGFFDALRSLAQSGEFALVVATRRSLADLSRAEQIATSPFWNIFARVDLGLFTQAEAEEFITTRFQAASVPVFAPEIARVIELSGRFPLFFEMACYHLFEAKSGLTTDWEAAFHKDDDVYSHLRYLWDCRSHQEQSAFRWVLDMGGRLPNDRVLLDLERRGLLIREPRESTGYWPFCPAFVDLIRKPPAPKTRKSRFSLSIKEYEFTLTPPFIKVKADHRQDK